MTGWDVAAVIGVILFAVMILVVARKHVARRSAEAIIAGSRDHLVRSGATPATLAWWDAWTALDVPPELTAAAPVPVAVRAPPVKVVPMGMAERMRAAIAAGDCPTCGAFAGTGCVKTGDPGQPYVGCHFSRLPKPPPLAPRSDTVGPGRGMTLWLARGVVVAALAVYAVARLQDMLVQWLLR